MDSKHNSVMYWSKTVSDKAPSSIQKEWYHISIMAVQLDLYNMKVQSHEVNELVFINTSL